jgi:alpha-galactosidase
MTNKSFHVGTVRHYLSFFLASLFGAEWYVDALDNGLARTPPMGWLSWERFGCLTNCRDYPDDCISEKLYLAQAEILVSDGYRDAGYVYVNIDDCWSEKERDPETGKLVPDKERFPNGIHGLAESLHSMKLKIGLYGDIGTATCEGYPGFQQHYTLDAQTLADWQVDSIKVDACNADENLFNDSYPEFGRELNKTGRPILYSCSWPNDYYEHHHHWEIPDYLNHGIKQTCNIWRNYFDIHDSWESVSVSHILHHYGSSASLLKAYFLSNNL